MNSSPLARRSFGPSRTLLLLHLEGVGHVGDGDDGGGAGAGTTKQDNCDNIVRLPIAMCVSSASEPLI